jgi:hypothetical protein
MMLPIALLALQAPRYEVPAGSLVPGKLVSWESAHGTVVHYLPNRVDANTKVLYLWHGTLRQDPLRPATDALDWFLGFRDLVERHNIALVMAVLSEDQFAAETQRPLSIFSLSGRSTQLDVHVNEILGAYQKVWPAWNGRQYFFGFQAGAEAITRYLVYHPNRAIHSYLIGPGNYFFPRSDWNWPDGYQPTLWYEVEWPKKVSSASRRTYEFRIQPEQVRDFSLAPMTAVVGDENGVVWQNPGRQLGNSFPTRAVEWSRAVRAHAQQWQAVAPVQVKIVQKSNNGHKQLSPVARRFFLESLEKK